MYLKSDVRISVRIGNGKTRKIDLIRMPSGPRFWVRLDKRKSKKMDNVTLTEVIDQLRRWIAREYE